MKNEPFKIMIITVSASIIALISLFTVPVSFHESWGEYWKMLDGFALSIRAIPILLLVGVIVLSILKLRTGVFLCSIGHAIFVIATTSFTLKYSAATFGLFIILLEMIIVLVGGIIQFKDMLGMKREETVIVQKTEKMLVEGEKEGEHIVKKVFGISIFVGVVTFVIGCNLTDRFDTRTLGYICIVLAMVILLVTILGFMYFVGCSIVVTDKRVYGKAAFGKRVDIPIDSISVVAKGFWMSIIVASSSGKIVFAGLKNQEVIHKVISELLIERQDRKSGVVDNKQISEADELMKFKQLLDCGAISQEEYEAKKKQLLDL